MALTYDIANWMSLVNDSKMLSELSIPGTHDSAAMKRPGFDSERLTTQTRTLREQLDAGVRFLDLRCGYVDKEFGLYHETTSLHLTFAAARDVCKQFLNDHPRETIIASIKNEYEGRGNDSAVSFQARFQQYVDETPGLWYLDNAIPTLGEVRKKIVLFRRFPLDKAMSPTGINAFDGFPDNETKTIDGPPTLTIQDRYSLVTYGGEDAKSRLIIKWETVEATLKKASSDTDTDRGRSVLYVNFSSAAGVTAPKYPRAAAEFINPKLESYFEVQGSQGRFGIIPRDYEALFGDVNPRIAHANVPYDAAHFVYLKSKRDGDVAGLAGGPYDNPPLIASPVNGSETKSQLWRFDVSGTAPYFVIGTPPGEGAISFIGAGIVLVLLPRSFGDDDPTQNWMLVPSDETAQYFFIASQRTRSSFVITLDGPRRPEGTPLMAKPLKESDNDDQLWSVVKSD
jgi:1-phosphatidylinositol phosphodiesterase